MTHSPVESVRSSGRLLSILKEKSSFSINIEDLVNDELAGFGSRYKTLCLLGDPAVDSNTHSLKRTLLSSPVDPANTGQTSEQGNGKDRSDYDKKRSNTAHAHAESARNAEEGKKRHEQKTTTNIMEVSAGKETMAGTQHSVIDSEAFACIIHRLDTAIADVATLTETLQEEIMIPLRSVLLTTVSNTGEYKLFLLNVVDAAREKWREKQRNLQIEAILAAGGEIRELRGEVYQNQNEGGVSDEDDEELAFDENGNTKSTASHSKDGKRFYDLSPLPGDDEASYRALRHDVWVMPVAVCLEATENALKQILQRIATLAPMCWSVLSKEHEAKTETNLSSSSSSTSSILVNPSGIIIDAIGLCHKQFPTTLYQRSLGTTNCDAASTTENPKSGQKPKRQCGDAPCPSPHDLVKEKQTVLSALVETLLIQWSRIAAFLLQFGMLLSDPNHSILASMVAEGLIGVLESEINNSNAAAEKEERKNKKQRDRQNQQINKKKKKQRRNAHRKKDAKLESAVPTSENGEKRPERDGEGGEQKLSVSSSPSSRSSSSSLSSQGSNEEDRSNDVNKVSATTASTTAAGKDSVASTQSQRAEGGEWQRTETMIAESTGATQVKVDGYGEERGAETAKPKSVLKKQSRDGDSNTTGGYSGYGKMRSFQSAKNRNKWGCFGIGKIGIDGIDLENESTAKLRFLFEDEDDMDDDEEDDDDNAHSPSTGNSSSSSFDPAASRETHGNQTEGVEGPRVKSSTLRGVDEKYDNVKGIIKKEVEGNTGADGSHSSSAESDAASSSSSLRRRRKWKNERDQKIVGATKNTNLRHMAAAIFNVKHPAVVALCRRSAVSAAAAAAEEAAVEEYLAVKSKAAEQEQQSEEGQRERGGGRGNGPSGRWGESQSSTPRSGGATYERVSGGIYYGSGAPKRGGAPAYRADPILSIPQPTFVPAPSLLSYLGKAGYGTHISNLIFQLCNTFLRGLSLATCHFHYKSSNNFRARLLVAPSSLKADFSDGPANEPTMNSSDQNMYAFEREGTAAFFAAEIASEKNVRNDRIREEHEAKDNEGRKPVYTVNTRRPEQLSNDHTRPFIDMIRSTIYTIHRDHHTDTKTLAEDGLSSAAPAELVTPTALFTAAHSLYCTAMGIVTGMLRDDATTTVGVSYCPATGPLRYYYPRGTGNLRGGGEAKGRAVNGSDEEDDDEESARDFVWDGDFTKYRKNRKAGGSDSGASKRNAGTSLNSRRRSGVKRIYDDDGDENGRDSGGEAAKGRKGPYHNNNNKILDRNLNPHFFESKADQTARARQWLFGAMKRSEAQYLQLMEDQQVSQEMASGCNDTIHRYQRGLHLTSQLVGEKGSRGTFNVAGGDGTNGCGGVGAAGAMGIGSSGSGSGSLLHISAKKATVAARGNGNTADSALSPSPSSTPSPEVFGGHIAFSSPDTNEDGPNHHKNDSERLVATGNNGGVRAPVAVGPTGADREVSAQPVGPSAIASTASAGASVSNSGAAVTSLNSKGTLLLPVNLTLHQSPFLTPEPGAGAANGSMVNAMPIASAFLPHIVSTPFSSLSCSIPVNVPAMVSVIRRLKVFATGKSMHWNSSASFEPFSCDKDSGNICFKQANRASDVYQQLFPLLTTFRRTHTALNAIPPTAADDGTHRAPDLLIAAHSALTALHSHLTDAFTPLLSLVTLPDMWTSKWDAHNKYYAGRSPTHSIVYFFTVLTRVVGEIVAIGHNERIGVKRRLAQENLLCSSTAQQKRPSRQSMPQVRSRKRVAHDDNNNENEEGIVDARDRTRKGNDEEEEEEDYGSIYEAHELLAMLVATIGKQLFLKEVMAIFAPPPESSCGKSSSKSNKTEVEVDGNKDGKDGKKSAAGNDEAKIIIAFPSCQGSDVGGGHPSLVTKTRTDQLLGDGMTILKYFRLLRGVGVSQATPACRLFGSATDFPQLSERNYFTHHVRKKFLWWNSFVEVTHRLGSQQHKKGLVVGGGATTIFSQHQQSSTATGQEDNARLPAVVEEAQSVPTLLQMSGPHASASEEISLFRLVTALSLRASPLSEILEVSTKTKTLTKAARKEGQEETANNDEEEDGRFNFDRETFMSHFWFVGSPSHENRADQSSLVPPAVNRQDFCSRVSCMKWNEFIDAVVQKQPFGESDLFAGEAGKEEEEGQKEEDRSTLTLSDRSRRQRRRYTYSLASVADTAPLMQFNSRKFILKKVEELRGAGKMKKNDDSGKKRRSLPSPLPSTGQWLWPIAKLENVVSCVPTISYLSRHLSDEILYPSVCSKKVEARAARASSSGGTTEEQEYHCNTTVGNSNDIKTHVSSRLSIDLSRFKCVIASRWELCDEISRSRLDEEDREEMEKLIKEIRAKI